MGDLYVRNGCMCYLCREPFNRPRVLDCGDSFCHECLDKILKENRGSALKCPQCHHPMDSKRTYPINTSLQKNVELSATYLQLIFNIYNEQLILRCTSIADFFSKSFRSRFPFFQVKFPKKLKNFIGFEKSEACLLFRLFILSHWGRRAILTVEGSKGQNCTANKSPLNSTNIGLYCNYHAFFKCLN